MKKLCTYYNLRGEREENKIDGAVALIMSMNRALNDDYVSLDDFLNDPLGADY